ncbi:hypothetical protein QBC36DRAFT_61415 [Triangularia setosa]|uniref:Uncharacterized protein n=1 Tax=Triangularia setosa TaxID=2587417 RepID=A0AAN6WDT7_9PEZI|nr:hypothetical protein QBC36DRAFT_61415 [Podospora setosa]
MHPNSQAWTSVTAILAYLFLKVGGATTGQWSLFWLHFCDFVLGLIGPGVRMSIAAPIPSHPITPPPFLIVPLPAVRARATITSPDFDSFSPSPALGIDRSSSATHVSNTSSVTASRDYKVLTFEI